MSQMIGLKKNYQFQRVFRHGKSKASKNIVIYCATNGLSINRVGFIVSKKVGNSVNRNRVKRVLREVYRINNPCLEQGYDFIFIARHRSSGIDYHTARKEFFKLMEKFRLVTPSFKEGKCK